MSINKKSLAFAFCGLILSGCAAQNEPVVYAEPVFTGKYDGGGGGACVDVAGAAPCVPPPCADGSTGAECQPGGGDQPGTGQQGATGTTG